MDKKYEYILFLIGIHSFGKKELKNYLKTANNFNKEQPQYA